MATAAQRRIKSVSYAKYGYIFILPFFIVYFIFALWPLLQTFVLAFCENGTREPAFIGLDNFKTILATPPENDFKAMGIHETFWRYFKNTLIIWVGNFIPQIALSLLLAVWFTDLRVKMPGKGFFKVVMYMPNIITAASVAGLFLALFGDSSYSVINTLRGCAMTKEEVAAAGLTAAPEPWKIITSVWGSRILVMFIQVWMWFGNTMIMLMSGIQGINESLFEAAEIDGANSTQTFWRITFPLLKTIMVYTLLTSMIGGLQMFYIPFMLHTGNIINENIATIAVFVYQMFHSNFAKPSFGYSGAASVILFVITSILGALVFYVQRDKDAIAKKKQRKAAIKAAKAKAKGGGFSI